MIPLENQITLVLLTTEPALAIRAPEGFQNMLVPELVHTLTDLWKNLIIQVLRINPDRQGVLGNQTTLVLKTIGTPQDFGGNLITQMPGMVMTMTLWRLNK